VFVLSDYESVSNETSFLKFFQTIYKEMKFYFEGNVSNTFLDTNLIKILYFNLFGFVLSDSESVSNETSFLKLFQTIYKEMKFYFKGNVSNTFLDTNLIKISLF